MLMQRYFHLLASVALAVSAGCSRGASETLGESFDAGAVFLESTPKITHAFRLSHRSDRTVTIKDIKRSCACTAAVVGKKTIAPGEAVALTMTVDAKPIYSNQSVVCTLETDHPTQPEWTYRLSFRTYPRVRFDAATIDLGELPDSPEADAKSGAGKAVWLETYEPATQLPVAAAPFDLDCRPPLSASVGGEPDTEFIEDGTVRRSRHPVRVAIDPSAGREGPSGTYTGTVTARTGPKAIASTVVIWSRKAPLEVSPPNLSFGLVNRPGDRSSRKVILRSRDDRPFRVLSVAGGAEDVAATGPDPGKPTGPAPTQVVELTFRRGPASRRFATGQAVIRTDHPEMPSLRVSWSAIAP